MLTYACRILAHVVVAGLGREGGALGASKPDAQLAQDEHLRVEVNRRGLIGS
jgi:hypothetical protein